MLKPAMGMIALLLAGCATGYQPHWYVNEIQAVNLSGAQIKDVRIDVASARKLIECDAVAQYAMCQQKFGKRRYAEQQVRLSWTHHDGEARTESLVPPVPAYYSTALPLRIVMEIDSDGSVKAFYEQEQPGRGGASYFAG